MKITDIKACSIGSPVTDWTYVKIETDEPACMVRARPLFPRNRAVGDLKKLLV